jgi:VanZ family protein
VATLWPFDPIPANELSWSPRGWGLRFGDYATLFSSGDAIAPPGTNGDCSLEIALVPALTDDGNVILAYAPRENPGQFRVGQAGAGFYVSREVELGHSRSIAARPYLLVPRVFRGGIPILITVTAGDRGTRVYIDGKLVASRDDFGLTASDLAGPIVVANSPTGNNSWSGLLQGIAVYSSQLSARDVVDHYRLWSQGEPANLRASVDSLYLFREGSGKSVHNLGQSKQPDLVMPAHYQILYPTFLHPFWKDFHLDSAKLHDMSNNVIAYIPLGFLACCWFVRNQKNGRAFWLAILFGSLLSLSLESLQYFLPMRNSDSMDWLTNTSGATIGALLGWSELRYTWMKKIPFLGRLWAYIRTPATR